MGNGGYYGRRRRGGPGAYLLAMLLFCAILIGGPCALLKGTALLCATKLPELQNALPYLRYLFGPVSAVLAALVLYGVTGKRAIPFCTVLALLVSVGLFYLAVGTDRFESYVYFSGYRLHLIVTGIVLMLTAAVKMRK